MASLRRIWARLRTALGGDEPAQSAERRRIAADLHDGPLQSLIALEMRLAAARNLAGRDPDAALKELGELAGLAARVVAELRAFQRTLAPPAEPPDLAALARRLVEDFGRETGLQVRLEAPEAPLATAPEICLEFAHLLREALANIRKHARASRVAVTLGGGGEVVIEDDGVGFPFEGKYELAELDALGCGPRSIIERVRNRHGELTLESRPGRGSRLEIRIPS